MGRPPVGKKAMTPAQRQARRRKRPQREKAKAEREAKRVAAQAKNAARYQPNLGRDWTDVHRPPAPPLDDPADELVDQIAEAIQLSPEITLADIRRRLPGGSTPRMAGEHAPPLQSFSHRHGRACSLRSKEG